MGVTNLLLDSQNEVAVRQLARQLGVNDQQARQVISDLSPKLTRGMQYHAEKDNGVEALLEALGRGSHGRYLDEPSRLGTADNVADGNAILGHIFGNKEVSRDVARNVGEQSGLGSTLIKKALPIVATMVMASLGKSVFGGGAASSPAPVARAQSGGLLTSLLDADNDGSVIDDVLGLAFKMAFR